MLKEFAFLKRAVSRVQSGGPFGCYHIYGGHAYAQNEAMQAVVPFPFAGEFSVPGVELEAALSRMVSEPTLAFDNNVLSVKSGRLRASVPCINEEPPALFDYDIEWKPLPDTLLSAIAAVLPFLIGKVGGWSSAIRLKDGRVTTINNRCGIDIAVPGLECPPSLITKETAEFLLANEGIEAYGAKPGAAFLFRWGDGRALHAQLIDQVMPDAVEQIFASAGRDAPVPITGEFREAYADAAAITESVIELRPDSIRVGRGDSKVTIDVETPVPEGHSSFWEAEVLTPVISTATSWNPAAYPKPALFKGPALYGLACGIKQ